MVKFTQTIRWQLPTNCLSVFDHFVGLALIGLKSIALQTCTKDIIFRETSKIQFATETGSCG